MRRLNFQQKYGVQHLNLNRGFRNTNERHKTAFFTYGQSGEAKVPAMRH